jgi:hypothetical protein
MADADLQQGPTVAYVNEVVLRGLRGQGISMTADCRITNDLNLTASQFVSALLSDGWTWPTGWLRRNRNFSHDADARHFEKEVEPDRWIHIVVSPGLVEDAAVAKTSLNKTKKNSRAGDWNLPPRNIELHAERDWSRPSSFRHLRQFLFDRLWPF